MILTDFKNTHFLLVLLTITICFCCRSQPENELNNPFISDSLVLGADQVDKYLPLLKNKKVAIVANQTSLLNFKTASSAHLVDYLHSKNITIQCVFAPEHGFRGKADAGELIKDGIDKKTGIPIISLYGKNKKPSTQQLDGVDIIIFDIQDVGARFYTYISTLHYVMEACAEAKTPLIVLDRPNPNGHYIDGPVLEKTHTSFVGMHPVPVVHGMTIGEYAQMINGEGWLAKKIQCDLFIVEMKNYTHQTVYSLPKKPSPNLPNDTSINLYPSLCFFEGTFMSAGRGTDMQFQLFGAPNLPPKKYPFAFTPRVNEGAKDPKFKNELCNGKDLRTTHKLSNLNLGWLIDAYNDIENNKDFFSPFFTKLAGTKKLQEQIEKGYSYQEIRKTWLKGLNDYDVLREKYLLYQR